MSNGKRYKKDDVSYLDMEERDLQEKYQKMLKEIELKNIESLENEAENFDNKAKAIQKIKDEILDSTEEILEKIENESNVNEDSKKLEELKEKIDSIEKQNLDNIESLNSDENKEDVEKSIEDIDKKIIFDADSDISAENINEKNEDFDKNKDINNIDFKSKKNKKTKNKKNTFIKILGKVLYYIAFIVVVFILLLVAVQRFSNNEVSVLGFRMFNIVTESMTPEYVVGDVLISKTVDPEEIKIGDDIVYIGEKKPFKDMVVTHRVVDLNLEKDGTYSFITRGIANNIDDPIISETQIYGKIIYKMHSFSILSKAVNNMYVFFFVIFIPLVLLISIKIMQIKHEKTYESDDD